jgi:mono/diheme cytochrome c family protein
MVRILSVVLIACTVALAAWGVITAYDELMPVGRMWETPAIKPHENPIPVMAAGSVPVSGGEAFFHAAAAEDLKPPFAMTDPLVIAAGKTAYGYYCVHCHGKNYDGYGTVGQSFAPKPRDLRGAKVQAMAAGTLFKEISFGLPDGRQPALATTMAPDDRWRVIAYVKSLGRRQ